MSYIVKMKCGRHLFAYQCQNNYERTGPKFYFSYLLPKSRSFAWRMAIRHRHVTKFFEKISEITATEIRHFNSTPFIRRRAQQRILNHELDCFIDFAQYE